MAEKVTYKSLIIESINELNDRKGSSMIAIKKLVQEKLSKDKKWQNATFLAALRRGVANGDLVQVKNSYKLSAEFKKKASAKEVATKENAKPPQAENKQEPQNTEESYNN
jgi:hypothetical protein